MEQDTFTELQLEQYISDAGNAMDLLQKYGISTAELWRNMPDHVITTIANERPDLYAAIQIIVKKKKAPGQHEKIFLIAKRYGPFICAFIFAIAISFQSIAIPPTYTMRDVATNKTVTIESTAGPADIYAAISVVLQTHLAFCSALFLQYIVSTDLDPSTEGVVAIAFRVFILLISTLVDLVFAIVLPNTRDSVIVNFICILAIAVAFGAIEVVYMCCRKDKYL